MLTKKLKIFFLIAGLSLVSIVSVNASEISGTLSQSPSTNNTSGSSVRGTVVSPTASTQSSGGGGYSGGGMVMPASGYSYGQEIDYSMGTVNIGGQGSPGLANSEPIIPAQSIKKTVVKKPVTYAQMDSILSENISQATDTDTYQNNLDYATNTGDTLDQDATTTPIQNNMNTSGTFDFFGISVWFWLIVLILALLIIAILYMQSL